VVTSHRRRALRPERQDSQLSKKNAGVKKRRHVTGGRDKRRKRKRVFRGKKGVLRYMERGDTKANVEQVMWGERSYLEEERGGG